MSAKTIYIVKCEGDEEKYAFPTLAKAIKFTTLSDVEDVTIVKHTSEQIFPSEY